MSLLQLFWVFFISGILGYGGGPASIPLIEQEVVGRYHWYSVHEFSEILALGNALPGPIATKLAGYIGFQQAGVLGGFVSVFAAVAPSLILMLAALQMLRKYKNSIQVQRMTAYVRPIIAVLLGGMAINFFLSSYKSIGLVQTVFLVSISYFLLEKIKIHPVYVIIGALVYGACFL